MSRLGLMNTLDIIKGIFRSYDIYVATDGNDTTGDGSKATPYLTLAKAETEASGGENIRVMPGTYTFNGQTFTKNLYWYGIGATLKNVGGVSIFITFANNTNEIIFYDFILDRDGTGTYHFTWGTGSNKILKRCNLINGVANFCAASQSTTNQLQNCTLDGGGTTQFLLSGGHSLTVDGCTISGLGTNGFYCLNGTDDDLIVKNCTITHNTAGGYLLYPRGTGTFTFDNNTINVTAAVNGFTLVYNVSGTQDFIFTNNTLNIGANSTRTQFFELTSGSNYDNITITGNTINVTTAAFSKTLFYCYPITSCIVNNNTIDFGPSTVHGSAVQIVGVDALVPQVKNNIIKGRNEDGYSILIGAETTGAGDWVFDGAIVEGNEIYSARYYDSGAGGIIHNIFVGFTKNAHIRYNKIYGGGDAVVLKGDGTAYTGGGIYNNVFDDCYNAILIKGVSGVNSYGNTMFSDSENYVKMFDIKINGAGEFSTDCLIKNNIMYLDDSGTGSLVVVDADSLSGVVFDYNCLYSKQTIAGYTFGVTAYNGLTAIQGQSQEANGFDADPLLNSSQELLSGSPCINTGVVLGANYDDALLPDTVWPDSILTGDQDSYGSGWEVGAFIYEE